MTTTEDTIMAEESAAGPSTQSLSSINAQLIAHGWAKRPLNLEALSTRDHTEVTAALYELLGSSVTNLTNLDNLAARYRTLTYEHERLQKQYQTNRLQAARMEAEVAGWKSRCGEIEKRYLAEEGKTKELREEVVRGRKALEGVRAAAGHETKKMQIKLDKANAQITKIANDPNISSRPQGLVLLNPISGGRAHPIAPPQHMLLEQSVKDLAEIRQSLQEETEAFRHVVVSTGNGLREALAAREGIDDPPRMLHSQFFSIPSNDPLSRSLTHRTASSTAHPSIADARLKGLIAEIRKKMTEGVVRTVIRAEGLADNGDEEERKKEERETERKRVELEEQVKDLQVEITCVRAREEEAKRLVEEITATQARMGSLNLGADNDDTDDGAYESLREQKRSLDDDKRKFTEASVRLTQERRQLEAERASFLEERRKADVESTLALLPNTPSETGVFGGSQLADPVAGPSSPKPSSWAVHQPSSPSPLSPSHRIRTPKPHSAKSRRTKTPLSRLVLEKAVRQKGRDTATQLELERLGASVLGEGGRKGNAARGKTRGSESSSSNGGMRGSTLGKHKSAGGLTASTMKNAASTLKSSTNLGVSIAGRSERDLSKADGVGPRTAAAKKIWR